jgi:hypothetical protein
LREIVLPMAGFFVWSDVCVVFVQKLSLSAEVAVLPLPFSL